MKNAFKNSVGDGGTGCIGDGGTGNISPTTGGVSFEGDNGLGVSPTTGGISQEGFGGLRNREVERPAP